MFGGLLDIILAQSMFNVMKAINKPNVAQMLELLTCLWRENSAYKYKKEKSLDNSIYKVIKDKIILARWWNESGMTNCIPWHSWVQGIQEQSSL